MSVTTTYDEIRSRLRDKLSECLSDARELLDEDIWGYDDMREAYDPIGIYKTIKDVKDVI